MVDAVKLLRQARRRSSAAATPSPVTPSMRPIESPTLWLRPFPLDGGDELRIWEDPRGTLAGGNGATCWDSALAFAEAVCSRGDDSLAATTDWRGLRVLELGSGCGLVALALACRGAHVVATERAIALPLLAKNVEANAAIVKKSGGTIESAALDWTAPDPRVLGRGYDAIVGADLCFAANAEGAAALARVVGDVLGRGTPFGILAQEIRERDETPATFLADLRRGGMRTHERAVNGASDVLYYELLPRPSLPHEALPAVLPFLPAEALAACSAVAKEWVAPDALWKDRVTREFGCVVASGPWRRRYLDLRESQLLEEAGTYAGLC
ncbi:unnamed protein product [Pelagomonas calceolata]|uniref:Calmodulin-lysine N-methyltransferase n=1 Tax=Pelagomonas calceolata TaxID=35677 RepID=A0A8J2SMH7_9STRA|nr:unnamed protein product [Pelagomonas calceolata]